MRAKIWHIVSWWVKVLKRFFFKEFWRGDLAGSLTKTKFSKRFTFRVQRDYFHKQFTRSPHSLLPCIYYKIIGIRINKVIKDRINDRTPQLKCSSFPFYYCNLKINTSNIPQPIETRFISVNPFVSISNLKQDCTLPLFICKYSWTDPKITWNRYLIYDKFEN